MVNRVEVYNQGKIYIKSEFTAMAIGSSKNLPLAKSSDLSLSGHHYGTQDLSFGPWLESGLANVTFRRFAACQVALRALFSGLIGEGCLFASRSL